MALIDDIKKLHDNSLKSLDASHDYYTHTKSAWELVKQFVQQGNTFTFRNQLTDNTVTETDVDNLAQNYIRGYLASATFQHFVSLFEQFVYDILRFWLTEYPDSLSGKEVKFKTVLESQDKDMIVAAVIEKEWYGLTHGKVADWFKYLEVKAKLGCPTKEQIEQLAEIKASRDILVHNDGVVNSIYIDKSMGRARFADGDQLKLPEQYHRTSWQLIKQIVTEVSDAAIDKRKD